MDDIGDEVLRLPDAGAQDSRAMDLWAPDFLHDCVMGGLKPDRPFVDSGCPVIACGSGFSSMLRGREFAGHAKVLSSRTFGAVLPMRDAVPLAVVSALGALDWVLRCRGASPIADGREAEQIRRRAKREIGQAKLVVFTFGSGGIASGCTAADVRRGICKIHGLLRRFAPGARMLLAVDPSPSTGRGRNAAAGIAVKSVLRSGLQEFLAAEASDLNRQVFYFPAYELTRDFPHAASLARPILEMFRAYYSSSGPSAAEAGRAYLTGRLGMIAALRRAEYDALTRRAVA